MSLHFTFCIGTTPSPIHFFIIQLKFRLLIEQSIFISILALITPYKHSYTSSHSYSVHLKSICTELVTYTSSH